MIRRERLNKVPLLLIEMARTVKVTAEKAAKERAREAGDKKNNINEKSKRGKQKEGPKNKGQEKKSN